MWNLYIEVIAILTIITIILGLLALYIVNNIHIIQLCKAESISITPAERGPKKIITRIYITSRPEYIALMLYNVCYIGNIKHYTITYNYTIITTPAIITETSKNCTLILIAPGDIEVYNFNNTACSSKNMIKQIIINVTPCGIYNTMANCTPYAKIVINVNNTCICAKIEDTSFKLAKKWCTGISKLYIWAGGLIKGVVR